MTLKITLQTLENYRVEDDARGYVIQDGWILSDDNVRIGTFTREIRNSPAGGQLNAGMLWMQLMFTEGNKPVHPAMHPIKPPQHITLHGAQSYGPNPYGTFMHRFGPESAIGSVSAASPDYAAYIGKPFVGGDDGVTIG